MIVMVENCSAQSKIEETKEIWIYDYFNPRGYTTAGVAGKFQELKNQNVRKFRLDPEFVNSLIDMLYVANTRRRVFQEKTGQNLIFAEFIMNDNDIRNIIIRSNGLTDYFVEKKAYFLDKNIWTEKIYKEILHQITNDVGEE